MSPNPHLSKNSQCKNCVIEESSVRYRSTLKEFIEKAKNSVILLDEPEAALSIKININ